MKITGNDLRANLALDLSEIMQELLNSPIGVVPRCADSFYDANVGVFCARRILSALQPAPMSVAEAARVEKWASELQEAITEMRYSILVQRASDRVRSVVQEMRGNEALASPEGE